MKRVIPSVLVVIFPYSILWHLCWVLGFGPIAFPKDWTIAEIYGLIILTWLIGLAATIWLTIVNASSKTDAKTAAWSNMLIKLLKHRHIFCYSLPERCSPRSFLLGSLPLRSS